MTTPQTLKVDPAKAPPRPLPAPESEGTVPLPVSMVRPPETRFAIVGDDEVFSTRVRRALSDLRARFELIGWDDAADDLARYDAVIFAEPIRGFRLESTVEEVRSRAESKRLPLFVVFDEARSQPKTDRVSRALYRAGVTAVFEWPRERSLLPLLMAEMLGTARIRGRAKKPDTALARTVRAHLKIRRRALPPVKLTVRRGVVEVQGTLTRLAEKLRVERLVAKVPGVRSVLTRGLHVLSDGTPDRAVKRRVKAHLEATLDSSAEATVVVRDGDVVVSVPAGAVGDRLELYLSLATLAGVRSLDLQLAGDETLAPRTARPLQNVVSLLYPKERSVRIDVIDGTAVLSGKASSYAVKKDIEHELVLQPGVTRVVNKLLVGR